MNRKIENDIGSYTLRLFDENLMTFKMSRTAAGSFVISVVFVNEKLVHLLPPDLQPDASSIQSWLKKRILPQNRACSREILDALSVSFEDLQAIVDLCFCLSLNDSYWVVPEGFGGSFEACNLYDHSFHPGLEQLAYSGFGFEPVGIVRSPELTTCGMLPKCWHRNTDGAVFLYKQGITGFSNSGREPFCEHMAWQIGKAMGLDIVEYQVVNWKGAAACRCSLFTDRHTALIPVGRLVTTGGLEAVIRYYKNLGDAFYQSLVSMLVFDVLISNEDRHLNNFGLLMDSHTGRFERTAPLYDHGMSLLAYIPCGLMKDFPSVCAYASSRTSPWAVDP